MKQISQTEEKEQLEKTEKLGAAEQLEKTKKLEKAEESEKAKQLEKIAKSEKTEQKALAEKLKTACWIARSLFDRNRTTGSSANMSFMHDGKIYITQSGSCFGRLESEQFSVLDLDGRLIEGKKPSKEYPLHLKIYQKKPETGAVIHTHGEYAVLWSFVPAENEADVIPPHTPYLRMKLGTVGMIPYEAPGSKELFDAFEARIMDSDGYLLKQHGAVVPGRDLMDAFYCLEELEESAKIAWKLRAAGIGKE